MISWYKDTAVQFAKPWCMTCLYHLCHWRRKNTPVKTKKQDSCIHFTAVPLCVYYHYYCYVLIQLHSSLVCFSLLSSILPLWVSFRHFALISATTRHHKAVTLLTLLHVFFTKKYLYLAPLYISSMSHKKTLTKSNSCNMMIPSFGTIETETTSNICTWKNSCSPKLPTDLLMCDR